MGWYDRDKKSRLSVRRFLNLPGHHGGAYVLIFVEDTDTDEHFLRQEEKNYLTTPEIVVELKDCDRAINFSFELESVAKRENALFKVNTLIYAFLGLRKALKAEIALAERRERELAKRPKAEA